MDVLFIIVVIVIVAVYFSPFFLQSLQASFPYFNSMMRVRYTIIFGGIGLLYVIAGAEWDIQDVFFGMIAGSLVDFLLRGQKKDSPS